MEFYSILLIAGIIVCWCLFRIFTNEDSDEDSDEDDEDPPKADTPDDDTDVTPTRTFTIQELLQNQDKYSWDENGCVFEVNADGSVTLVGKFDPAGLQAGPHQGIYEQMAANGLLEMLPRMWSYTVYAEHSIGHITSFIMTSEDGCLFPSCDISNFHGTINQISFSRFTHDGPISPIIDSLRKSGTGLIILMPGNEKEFILSLGAQSCINRIFKGKVRVRISSPATMGAFNAAFNRNHASGKVSFAFGHGEDFKCCTMAVGKTLHVMRTGQAEIHYVVKELSTSSIIQPTENTIALQQIAQGCIQLSKPYCGYLFDKIPYTMSLLLKENGQPVKIHNLSIEPDPSDPSVSKSSPLAIAVMPTQSLAFMIGSFEIVEDLVSESKSPYGLIVVSVECNHDSTMVISTKSAGNIYKINIGELIG